MTHLFNSRRRCVPSLGSQARLGQEHTGDLQKECCTTTSSPTNSTAHPFTVLAGSTNGNGTVAGTGTIEFDVPVNAVQYLRLIAFAQVWDQEGATAHAFADPQIIISPNTPNAGQYVVVQSSNIFPIPEIDPAGMGSVVALITGALGLLEQRRRRIPA